MANAKGIKHRKHRVDVYLNDEELEALNAVVADSGLSRTEFMRQLLVKQCDNFRHQFFKEKTAA